MNYRITVNAGALASKTAAIQKAQLWLANEVTKDMRPYTPFRTGMLANSAQIASDGSQIKQSTPYARRMYYGSYNYNKAFNPQAGASWFEKAKGSNLAKWLQGAQAMIAGRG